MKVARRARLVDLGQVLLRQREQHRDGAHLRDDDDAGIGGAHEVADVHEAEAGASVYGGGNRGVVEERACIVDGRLVGFHLGLELRDERALRVDRLDGHDVGGKLQVALEIELGVGELCLIQRLLGDGLVELRLVGDGIDVRQHVAALHVLAFLEVNGENLAVDLRADGDGVAGLGRADPFEPHRHIGDTRLHGDDRDRAICAAGAAPPALTLLDA